MESLALIDRHRLQVTENARTSLQERYPMILTRTSSLTILLIRFFAMSTTLDGEFFVEGLTARFLTNCQDRNANYDRYTCS